MSAVTGTVVVIAAASFAAFGIACAYAGMNAAAAFAAAVLGFALFVSTVAIVTAPAPSTVRFR